jgi:hypothetical protein
VQGKGSSKRAVLRDPSEQIKLPEGTTPAIVSGDLWDRAQAQFQNSRGYATRNQKCAYLLRGLVFCANCGRPMYISPRRDKPATYRCASDWRRIGERCGGREARVERVEAYVWCEIEEVMRDPDRVRRELEKQIEEGPDLSFVADLKSCERQLANIERGQQRLIKQLMNSSEDLAAIIERELAATDATKAQLREMVAELRARISVRQATQDSLQSLSDYCERVKDRLPKLTFEQKRTLIEALTAKATVCGKEYSITLKDPRTGAQLQKYSKPLAVGGAAHQAGTQLHNQSLERSCRAIRRRPATARQPRRALSSRRAW